ncbi:hypothetical protein KFZ76_07280 [Methylovulum psychrotolerans]|uniref:hypothetical protein n=1 Tax=Methylovulum psychrotolerans TaxID=1704499 RepID=UPI001BFF1212|nr:hypothetical protein [Methylovulum psychrotolerans]MBT9097513.1 hypothetical protein [Methylovulum psychrotolerans]
MDFYGIGRANGGYIDNSLRVPLPRRKFAVGGLITGPGTETSDSIHGVLPPGSFVIKAASAKPVLSSLQMIVKDVQDGVQSAGGVPVRLSNNEFLVPPEAVKKYGLPFFDHINRTGAITTLASQSVSFQGVDNTSDNPISGSPKASLPRRKFAVGGLITGPGTETSDSIHRVLPPGSFVVKAASAKRVLPALQAIVKDAQDSVPPGGIPVSLSNNEFLIPPQAVKKYGLPFFDHINKTGTLPVNNLANVNIKAVMSDKPPAALQRALGGSVGTAPAAAPSMANAITINLPINVTGANDNPSGSGKGQLNFDALQALSKDLQNQVDARVQHHMRPGGLLYKVFRG